MDEMYPGESSQDPTVPPGEKPKPFSVEPECSIDWANAQLTPAFLAALARAQAAVTTVGKDATETDKGYRYATADAIIAELRRAFAPQGISFIVNWATWDPPNLEKREIGEKQWCDWAVRCDWALLFGSNDHTEVGKLTGHTMAIAIGSKGRPPDKSAFAARTSIAGYTALGLGAIDRAIIDPDEDIHQRDGDRDVARRSTRGNGMSLGQIKTAVHKGLMTISEAWRLAGLPPMIHDHLRDHVHGSPFNDLRMKPPEAFAAWSQLLAKVQDYVDNLNERIAADVARHNAEMARGDST